jgi:hypothetical protein
MRILENGGSDQLQNEDVASFSAEQEQDNTAVMLKIEKNLKSEGSFDLDID